jgi:hypothetical protein
VHFEEPAGFLPLDLSFDQCPQWVESGHHAGNSTIDRAGVD